VREEISSYTTNSDKAQRKMKEQSQLLLFMLYLHQKENKETPRSFFHSSELK